jgi:hypothetical protein
MSPPYDFEKAVEMESTAQVSITPDMNRLGLMRVRSMLLGMPMNT